MRVYVFRSQTQKHLHIHVRVQWTLMCMPVLAHTYTLICIPATYVYTGHGHDTDPQMSVYPCMQDGDEFVFMDMATFDTMNVPKNVIGEQVLTLKLIPIFDP